MQFHPRLQPIDCPRSRAGMMLQHSREEFQRVITENCRIVALGGSETDRARIPAVGTQQARLSEPVLPQAQRRRALRVLQLEPGPAAAVPIWRVTALGYDAVKPER